MTVIQFLLWELEVVPKGLERGLKYLEKRDYPGYVAEIDKITQKCSESLAFIQTPVNAYQLTPLNYGLHSTTAVPL